MASKQLTAVSVTDTMPKMNTSAIPIGVKTCIAQTVFEAIQTEFQRPEIRADYERWKAERAAAKGLA